MAEIKKNNTSSWVYTVSLIASFMIGLDCFVIGFIFLYPFVGLLPAILIASGGWVLNTFVYFKDGPENINELIANEKKRSMGSWFINIIAFLGALFVFLFTIYAYLALSAAFPALGFWVTPFIITTMAIAYGIGTFTLNKSELTKDLLDDDTKSYYKRFKESIFRRIGSEKQDYFTLTWRFCTRIFIPVFVALLVSFAMTVCFLNGASLLLVGCGMAYLQPLLMVLALSFFIAELYFNAKQNIELVDKLVDSKVDDVESSKFLTPGMLGILLIVVANAITNGFIAMDATFVAISAIAIIKCVSGAIQSFSTMLNSCVSFVQEDEGWNERLFGGQGTKVLIQSSFVFGALLGLYFLSVFMPMGLLIAIPFTIGILYLSTVADSDMPLGSSIPPGGYDPSHSSLHTQISKDDFKLTSGNSVVVTEGDSELGSRIF
tara:strand:+ start:78 stop:1376 length:1299 start_codon:yes stop_codon:yes gene_type:complete